MSTTYGEKKGEGYTRSTFSFTESIVSLSDPLHLETTLQYQDGQVKILIAKQAEILEWSRSLKIVFMSNFHQSISVPTKIKF